MCAVQFFINNHDDNVSWDMTHLPSFSHFLQCFSGEDLLGIVNVDHEDGIRRQSFQELCPALVYQIASGVCSEDHHEEGAASRRKLSQGEGE